MWNPFSPRENRVITRESVYGDETESGISSTVHSSRTANTYWRLYKTNPIIRSAVNEVVRTLVSIPLIADVWDANAGAWIPLPPTDPLMRFLSRPSVSLPRAVYYKRFWMETVVTGNGFIWKQRAKWDGGLVDSWPMDSRYVMPVPGTQRIVDGYRFNPSKAINTGAQFLDPALPDPDAIIYAPEDIIHLPIDVDPDNKLLGLSPLAAALDDADLDAAITEFTHSVISNGGAVDKAFVTKTRIGDEEATRIERRWFRRRSGPRNAGKFVVIDGTEGTLENVGMALSSREMGLTDLRKQVEARILMTMNVPPIVVGSVVGIENATYSNYSQARLAMHEENTDPNLWLECSVFEHGLSGEFPEHRNQLIRIRPDLSRVMALLDWEDKRRRLSIAEYREGLSTQTEARASVDKPPLPNGDFYTLPLNVTRIDPNAPEPITPNAPGGVPVADAETRSRLRDAARVGDYAAAYETVVAFVAGIGCPESAVADVAAQAMAHFANTALRVADRASRILTDAEFLTAERITE